MKYYCNTIIVLLVFFAPSIMMAQEYSFEKIPDWVKLKELPQETTVSKYDVATGYYYTMADYQVNLEEEAFFNHEVVNVISYSGITNASQLSVTYDTVYQELKIHHLYIWRKGEKIDRTKELSFEILNNEQNLHRGIYTGQITAYDILSDIRKDDLIDFAYTLIGDNPIFDGEKYLSIPLEMINPVDLYSLRVLYPKEKDYTYRCVDCDGINLSVGTVDDYQLIEIVREEVKPMKFEKNMPRWSIPYKYFTLTSFHSWRDVNSWAQEVFAMDKEPELDVVFNEIFEGGETTEEKINKIIDFVQNDIRYMGIESGIGSIKPFSPEQVVKQRFGDCKDKSQLLVSLLKKIGVEKSFPVLVNTVMRHNVDKLYPSNQAFNHCIVKFDYDNTTYWVDPTAAQQGGDFRNLYNYDHGKVLVVGVPDDTLHNMSPAQIKSGIDLVDEYTINSFTDPATVKMTTQRYGYDADQRRVLLEYYAIKDINEQLTKNMKLLYPVVTQVSEAEILDDIEANCFIVNYNYEIDNFWEDREGFRTFQFEPLPLYQYFRTTVCEDREYDYMMPYPLDFHYQVIFHFPKDVFYYDDIKVCDNEAFYYEEKSEQLSSNSLQIDYRFRTKTNCIDAEGYKEICEQMSDITEGLPMVIYFEKR